MKITRLFSEKEKALTYVESLTKDETKDLSGKLKYKFISETKWTKDIEKDEWTSYVRHTVKEVTNGWREEVSYTLEIKEMEIE